MQRITAALFVFLAVSALLSGGSIAEAVYPGGDLSAESVESQNPLFLFFSSSPCSLIVFEARDPYFFEFSESGAQILYSCDVSGLSSVAYPHDAPVLVPGRIYAWLLVSCGEERTRSSPKFFSVNSAGPLSGLDIKAAADEVLGEYDEYRLLLQAGYSLTGRVYIDGIEADAKTLMKYFGGIRSGKSRIRCMKRRFR